jgi:hypothetical protein
VREGNEEREGGPREVKKERDREYDEWVPRQQNRRGREITRVQEMRGLEYLVLDIGGSRTRPILEGVKRT